MVTKFGYTIKSSTGVTIEEAWGFESFENMMDNMLANRCIFPIDSDIAIYQTTHRNYFGKQFKQVACKRIN